MVSRRRTLVRTGLAWALITAIVCAVMIVWAGKLYAHEPYTWIAKHYGVANDEKWKNGDFGGCCGPKDCFPVQATFMQQNGVPGWRVDDTFGGFVPDKDARPSHDPQGRHWRCYILKRDMALGFVPDRPRVDAAGRPCFFPSRGDF